MGGCSILTCRSRSEQKCTGVTFHSFPTAKIIRDKWIKATGRQNWQPTKSSKICSVHFDRSCFIETPQKTHLIASAVPLKYVYDDLLSGQASTSHDFKEAKNEKFAVKRKNDNKVTADENMSPNKKICTDEILSGQASTSYDSKATKNETLSVKGENYNKVTVDENISPNKKISTGKDSTQGTAISACQKNKYVSKTETPAKRKRTDIDQNISPMKRLCLIKTEADNISTSRQPDVMSKLSPVESQEKCDSTVKTKTDRVLLEVQNIPPSTINSSQDPKYCQAENVRAELVNIEMQKKLQKQKQLSDKRLKKLKAVRQSRRRLVKKVALLENILTELKSKNLINTEESVVLSNVENENKDFLKRFLLKDNCPRKYSSSLRRFALCLNFISPKAYTYVRKTFSTCLPHPKTLCSWYRCVDCEPGFTHESLEAIKTLASKSSEKIVVALSMDEMSIRQHLQWDGKQTVGYVSVGDNVDSDSLQIAKDALVFMVTAINGSWKLPVGYFLTNGVNSEQRSSLTKTCVQLLAECNVMVASLTFDGCPSNLAMAKLLGASFDDPANINSLIKLAGQEIVIFPDPCHMVKLARNTLGDKKKLTNGDGKIVSWELIKKLHELQETEGLHLANKLRKSHVEFKKQIMKVRLATQTFSKSVAEALRFCKELELADFEDAGATADFVEYFNDIFDILNSRRLFSYGLKKPISKENYPHVLKKIQEFVGYVHGLKIDGVSILKSGRKTGFLGLLICVESLKTLYDKIISKDNAPLKYLCTYKMSQDHLEIFFGAIRSKGGFNNNPTVIQFKAAYKRLLIHGELKNIYKCGNCIDLGDINILNINKSDYLKKINTTSNKLNEKDVEEDNENLPIDVPDTHDYLQNNQLTEFSREVTIYIGGFIVKKMKKQLKCAECIFALLSTDNENVSRLIARRDVGGLNYPSKDVIEICIYSERVVRTILNCQGPHYFVDKNNMPRIILKVFKYFVDRNVFSSLQSHITEQGPFDNHLSLLIKSVAMRYFEVRVHHVLKMISSSDARIRNQLTKLILFKGQ